MRHFLIIAILFFSCEAKELNSEIQTEQSIPSEQASQTQDDSSPTNQFIIKTANYRFQVTDVNKSTRSIEDIVKQYQSVVAEMNQVTTGYDISNSFVIRVPSQHFEKLIEELGKEAIFTDYKRIKAEDVTEEFVDIESRLKTKKEVRDRYIDILKNKAKTVEEVLKAENEIRTIQEEIEAKEGRLKYLQNRVALSTINLEIYQRVEYKETPSKYEKPYITKVKEGFLNGWEIITATGLILINIWPLVLIGVVVYWRRKWIKEKITRKV